MEEILHHLIGSLSVYPIIYRILYVHPRWLFVISSINFDPFTVYPPEKEPTRPENFPFFCDRNSCFNLVHPSVEGTKNITSW